MGIERLHAAIYGFSQGFCLHTCHACTKACPTGAIKFLTSKEKLRVKIGTAKFKKSLCVVKPTVPTAQPARNIAGQAIEMIPFGKLENSLYIPHVHEDVCIGCGACEYICPVTLIRRL
ncbi:MAG: 4Fe-4S binding protein [Bacilli bacterium]